MTEEERNTRPNKYGELTSKHYVPGAEVFNLLFGFWTVVRLITYVTSVEVVVTQMSMVGT